MSVEREFVGLDSPVVGRAGSGGYPARAYTTDLEVVDLRLR